MIIAFTGKKGSGKTTAAKEIVKQALANDHGPRWSLLSFADPLRAMAKALLIAWGENPDELYKEASIEGLGVSYREILQSLGTQWGRHCIRDDLWVDLMRRRIERGHQPPKNQYVVIDDVRFENEADFIRDEGGLIVHITRPGHVSDDIHESEHGIVYKPGDETLINNGDADFLHQVLCLVRGVVS